MARVKLKLQQPISAIELDLDEDSLSVILPEAEIEKKLGEWGKENDCSECGFKPWFERDIHTLHYCPNCGAKMMNDDV